MVLVMQYEFVWKLSNASYKKLLTDIAAGKEYDLDKYGKQFGGTLVPMRDLDAAEAQSRLACLSPNFK